MGDHSGLAKLSLLRQSKWPYNNTYFVSDLMDAEGTLNLLISDAKFQETDSDLSMLDITKAGTSSSCPSTSEKNFDAQIRMSDLEHGDTRIVFMPQRRRYPRGSTVNTYGVNLSSWLKILSSGDILPDAVEILHENNGGWGIHISDCSDVKGKSCITTNANILLGKQACAYHVWMKPRPWWHEEHFVYARHDFHSGKNFLLVAGSSLDSTLQNLRMRFDSATTSPHLFSILLALTTSWIKDLGRFVWDQDFATQKLESDTGWSLVGHTQLRPLPPAKLSLRRDLVTTKETLSHASRASESYHELFNFLSKKVHLLPAATPSPSCRIDQFEAVFLQHSIRQWHQKQQADALKARIDAQWNAVNALVAQHNNSLNYQIAADSRTDTVIMRRISFVTIAFLPATFLATFFSMIFFDMNAGHITVSPMIWIYVVCVVPVTLVIAWQSSTLGLTLGLSRIWKREGIVPGKRGSSWENRTTQSPLSRDFRMA